MVVESWIKIYLLQECRDEFKDNFLQTAEYFWLRREYFKDDYHIKDWTSQLDKNKLSK